MFCHRITYYLPVGGSEVSVESRALLDRAEAWFVLELESQTESFRLHYLSISEII